MSPVEKVRGKHSKQGELYGLKPVSVKGFGHPWKVEAVLHTWQAENCNDPLGDKDEDQLEGGLEMVFSTRTKNLGLVPGNEESLKVHHSNL